MSFTGSPRAPRKLRLAKGFGARAHRRASGEDVVVVQDPDPYSLPDRESSLNVGPPLGGGELDLVRVLRTARSVSETGAPSPGATPAPEELRLVEAPAPEPRGAAAPARRRQTVRRCRVPRACPVRPACPQPSCSPGTSGARGPSRSRTPPLCTRRTRASRRPSASRSAHSGRPIRGNASKQSRHRR
jgi:hypothetical protein